MTLDLHISPDKQPLVESMMNRYPAWFGLGVALALGGCHNSEEDSWKICCLLNIVRAEAPSPPGQATIIAWQRRTLFRGDGTASDASDSYPPGSWKKGCIESEVADFLTRTPETSAGAYFAGLGMACRRLLVAQERAERCEIEMPITAECWSRNLFFPGGAPLPKGLRKPFPADDQGNVVAELHGLATDPATGDALPIGRSSDYLRAIERPGKNFWREGQSEKILWEGAGTAERWRAAMEAHNRINERNLTYNGTGGDLNGPRDWDAPVPPVIAGNSNSANRAFIDAMGLRLPSMPTMAPGTENQLLEQKLIDQIQQNNGIPPRPRGGLF